MTENEKKRVSELRSAGLGYTAISKQLSISVNTVKSYCRRNSLPSLKATKTCEQCCKPIVQNPKYKPKRFCCDACRNKWWNSHLHLVKRKAITHLPVRLADVSFKNTEKKELSTVHISATSTTDLEVKMEEAMYQTTMYFTKMMLEQGLISEDEYRKIEADFLEKYHPVIGGLYSNLTNAA